MARLAFVSHEPRPCSFRSSSTTPENGSPGMCATETVSLCTSTAIHLALSDCRKIAYMFGRSAGKASSSTTSAPRSSNSLPRCSANLGRAVGNRSGVSTGHPTGKGNVGGLQ